jgi:DNA repair exonuclease SbcCD ATPase subunit
MSEEETVVEESISEESMEKINQEIEQVESKKLDAAKEEGRREVTSEIDKLKQELKELKDKNETTEKTRAEEAERQRLLEEIKREKERLEQPVRKHIAPESPNPIGAAPAQPAPQEQPKLSREDEWREFEKRFDRISVSVK